KIEDLKRFVGEIQQREDYSPWTKQLYKVTLRKFYKWMKQTEEYPPEVSWIKINVSKSEKKLPSEGELLTENEVRQLINSTNNLRDKALISVLYESGCRVGEIGTMRIKNVSSDKYGILLSVRGKTGARKIRIVSSLFALNSWLSVHPFKFDNEKPLWVRLDGKQPGKLLCYDAIRVMLKNAFNKAGIKKKHNPHFFRHSRATQMANHLTEFQMNQYFGWAQGSDMPSTYVHLSGRETDGAILAMNGIIIDKNKDTESSKPLLCPRCDYLNPHGREHCIKCDLIIDEGERLKQEIKDKDSFTEDSICEDTLTKLFRKPRFRALVMSELGNI
ncbi:tyrosine-type recombinase/integrase, partial [Candidatus Woesearchaeota archaeon]|nr:tyrosine-type recombinase/integrase [Candidatus Woesearchaeota archaeon]